MQIALRHVTDAVPHYPAQVLRPCLLPARLPGWRPLSSMQAWRTTPAPMAWQRASSGSLEPLSSPSLLHYGPSRCCYLQNPPPNLFLELLLQVPAFVMQHEDHGSCNKMSAWEVAHAMVEDN